MTAHFWSPAMPKFVPLNVNLTGLSVFAIYLVSEQPQTT